MKTITLYAMLTLISAMVLSGQPVRDLKKTNYAIELSQFITGSGFKSGTELNVTVISEHKRNLSLGFYFCSELAKVTGITMHHEVAVIRNPSIRKVVPFAFYNMIFRVTRANVSLPDQPESVDFGMYKSFEHHVGMGLDVRVLKNLHAKGRAGYGVYFGSIKKPEADPFTGEIYGSNGFSPMVKIGISYIL
jgi:hypothetical protein